MFLATEQPWTYSIGGQVDGVPTAPYAAITVDVVCLKLL